MPHWQTAWRAAGRSALAATVMGWSCVPLTAAQLDVRSSDRVDTAEAGRDDGPFFYTGLTYGSDAYLGPLDVLLNKGFDLAQVENRDRRIFGRRYATKHVMDAILHPFDAVERFGGWWRFLSRQVLPFTLHERQSKWFPNYFGHTLTGGILSRRLGEWMERHGVPAPMLVGGVLTMGAALLNEAYEHGGLEVGTAGTVADLYIFDLGGILLFTNDAVARFFARKLNANVWPSQASIVMFSGELANSGNHLVMKIPWGLVPRSSLFLRTGLDGQLGLTLHRPDGFDLSVAAGIEARQMHMDSTSGEEWVDFALSAGVYLDRHGSLMGSVVASGVPHRWITINIYPGVSGVLGGRIGGWMVLSRDWKVRIGLSTRVTWGVGLGLAG